MPAPRVRPVRFGETIIRWNRPRGCMRAWVAMVACLLLAACLSGRAPTPEDDEGPRATLPKGFSYRCPPGITTNMGGVCVGRIASGENEYFEPHLAIHPGNPSIMAIGVNAVHSVDRVAVNPPTVMYGDKWMEVFVSRDAGASWSGVTLPYNAMPNANPTPLRIGNVEDPSLEFDSEGTLHVAAMVSARGDGEVDTPDETLGNIGAGILYTQTKDLGRTWSPSVGLTSDANNQMEFLTVDRAGRVFVSWWTNEHCDPCASEVGWSLDSGRKWQSQAPSQVPKTCGPVSNVVVVDDVPVFACAALSHESDGWKLGALQVYGLDVGNGAVALRGRALDMRGMWPRLTVLANGSLAMSGDVGSGERHHVWVSRSDDGGKTWIPAVDVAGISGLAVNWRTRVLADPWGLLHVMGMPNSNGGSNTDRFHVVLDPSDMKVVFKAQFAKAHATTAPSPAPDPLRPVYSNDHYSGLAFSDSHGVAAWSRDGGIDFTFVSPVLAAGAVPAS